MRSLKSEGWECANVYKCVQYKYHYHIACYIANIYIQYGCTKQLQTLWENNRLQKIKDDLSMISETRLIGDIDEDMTPDTRHAPKSTPPTITKTHVQS